MITLVIYLEEDGFYDEAYWVLHEKDLTKEENDFLYENSLCGFINFKTDPCGGEKVDIETEAGFTPVMMWKLSLEEFKKLKPFEY